MQYYFGLILIAVLSASRCDKPVATGMMEVLQFGSNPGALQCYEYIPEGRLRKVPLVVVLHGCVQDAQEMARLTGWNSLAEQEKFIVLYPQQQVANNLNRCFNWYQADDIAKNAGEALSIRQMIDHVRARHSVDDARIFVTGMSAGGAMTAVMAAVYPELFDGSAVLAGVPYEAATNLGSALLAMGGSVSHSPETWAEKVRSQNPGYAGPYPPIAIFHGTDDPLVKIANAGELVKQWSNLLQVGDVTATEVPNFEGNTSVSNTTWARNGKPVIVRYDITGLGHAIPVDPGAGPRQGGETATYAKDLDFHSTWWAAHFFGIVR